MFPSNMLCFWVSEIRISSCYLSHGATAWVWFVFSNSFFSAVAITFVVSKTPGQEFNFDILVSFGCLDTVLLGILNVKMQLVSDIKFMTGCTLAKYHVVWLAISNWVKFGWIAWKDWGRDCWIFHLSFLTFYFDGVWSVSGLGLQTSSGGRGWTTSSLASWPTNPSQTNPGQ